MTETLLIIIRYIKLKFVGVCFFTEVMISSFKWILFFSLLTSFLLFVSSEDFYKLLNVARDASKAEIRKAFKKLALEKHPDKNKDDATAHDTFTKINTAYEVLKDDELRKKYDLYGEEGLKDNHFANQYQSWTFYNEQFGIYDDDPEIITLSKADFEQSVLGSEDIWFINFYSPHCSHCHTIAPTWRELSRELNGVIRIGAVNCHDDWMLCNMQAIRSYPSLKLYPTDEYYYGDHEKEKMVSFILNRLDVHVIKIKYDMIEGKIQTSELPWVISFCEEDTECVSERTLLKLSAMLDNLAHVGVADCSTDPLVCKDFFQTTSLQFYSPGKINGKGGQLIQSLETQDIMEQVLRLLPGPFEINDRMFQQIRRNISEGKSEPWVLVFRSGNDGIDLELRKLTALVHEINIASIDCASDLDLCTRFHVSKHPSVLLYKKGGFEYHHGRYNAFDIANFAKESMVSNVRVLGPEDLHKISSNDENWYVDFFAPWCPPCMKLLPEWRKAGKQIGGEIAQFGTIDCTIHLQLCQQYNVRSYPTIIFYNKTDAHLFSGTRSAEDIIAFAEDILNPPVTILTPETFEALVGKKSIGETWLVDFYAPWCGPCMELAPTYRKLAKRLKGDALLGQIDCQQYGYFCNVQGVSSYPTIRLYPYYAHGYSQYIRHQGWRDLENLYIWVFQHFPSLVEDIDEVKFYQHVIDSEQPWVLDFYAPWCGHCHSFAPHYAKLAKRFEGKVKAGKVNCEAEYGICRQVGIRAYPTVKFYPGILKEGTSQDMTGTSLNTLDTEYIYNTCLQLLEHHQLLKQKERTQSKVPVALSLYFLVIAAEILFELKSSFLMKLKQYVCKHRYVMTSFENSITMVE